MGTGKITRVEAEDVDVEWSGVTQHGVIGQQFPDGWYGITSSEGSAKSFLFACN